MVGEPDGGESYNYFRIIYPFTSPEYILNKRLEKLEANQEAFAGADGAELLDVK